jgi:hypothetical protein
MANRFDRPRKSPEVSNSFDAASKTCSFWQNGKSGTLESPASGPGRSGWGDGGEGVLKREPDRPVHGRANGNFPFRETPAEVGSRALNSRKASSQARKQSWIQATAGDGMSRWALAFLLGSCRSKRERRSCTGLLFESLKRSRARSTNPNRSHKTYESASTLPRFLPLKCCPLKRLRGGSRGVSIEAREGLTRGVVHCTRETR